MKIVVCYKLVPDEQDIVINADSTLSLSRAEWKIGQYDINGVEAGVKLAETTGGSAVALSVGGTILENSKLRKGILSRGPAELLVVADERLEKADSNTTAKVLAKAIEKIGGVDLVICGEGSGDSYSQQVGVQLGQILGAATWNGIRSLVPSAQGLAVERALEEEVETLEIELPAVVSVTSDINVPRIPSMKEILAAGKKTTTQWSLADVGVEFQSSVEVISTLAPEQTDRKQILIEGQGEDEIQQLFEYLKKEVG